MNSFSRVLRLSFRYRGTLLGVVATSLIVGVLWGANIGVVYPFVEVVFKGQSLQEWIDKEIAAAEQRTVELLAQQAANDIAQAQAPTEQTARTAQNLIVELEAEQKALKYYRWLQPPIHKYLPKSPFQTLAVIVAALFLGSMFKDLFLVANIVLVERLVQLVMFDLRKQFFRQALRWDAAAFGENRNSELLSHFTYDLNALSAGLNSLFGKSLREPLKMLACLIGACFISWRLLVVSLLISPPALYLMQRLAGSIKRANIRAMQEMSQLYNKLTETFSGMQTVKAFTMEAFERNRFHHSAKQFYHKSMKIVFYNALTKPITELLGIGVISLALISGAYLVLNQETKLLGIPMCDRPLSLSSLLLFYGLLAGISDPARKISEVFGSLQAGLAAADRVLPVIDREPAITDPPSPRVPVRPHHRLIFENVHFHYQPGHSVLQGIDLEIEYGETIAIVGPNGCGKSTLVNLLLRFYDPVRGAVRLDDIDLREMRMRDLRAQMGLVSQQTHLFDDTVMNNIRYGRSDATDEQVMAAAKQAHAHSFIMERLSDGYQTQVGTGGNRLSGGQRQRLALARAILRNPELLILDEATSQIDIESEQAIHTALEEFARDRTAIIITHRLSTLRLADRIVVMEAGRIIDMGQHEELLQRCRLYARLHDIHFRQCA